MCVPIVFSLFQVRHTCREEEELRESRYHVRSMSTINHQFAVLMFTSRGTVKLVRGWGLEKVEDVLMMLKARTWSGHVMRRADNKATSKG